MSLEPDHPDRADIASRLGEVLGRLGQRAEAEPLLRRGLAGFRRVLGDRDPRTREAVARLAAFRASRRTAPVQRR